MDEEDWATINAFLTNESTFRLWNIVERIDMHISNLFFTGALVFKLKRALHLPYLDFFIPEQRLVACEKEVHLNRRTAPELYLDMRRITEGASDPEFEGAGPLLDAVVEMRRFDQNMVFNAMAQRGALTSGHLHELARKISTLHADAPVKTDTQGAEIIASVLRVNAGAFLEAKVFAEADIARLGAAFEADLHTRAARLDARARAGNIRRCHGELRLRNICLYEKRVRLLDCLEFNEALATVDVLYDLAFLAMDLLYRGLHVEASQVLNRYYDISGQDGRHEDEQEDGHVLLPFFMALRGAAVRAHVTATQADSAEDGTRDLATESRAYFNLAECLLADGPARLVARGRAQRVGQVDHRRGTRAASRASPGRAGDEQRTHPQGYVSHGHRSAAAARGLRARGLGAGLFGYHPARRGLLANGVTVIADAVHHRAKDRTRIVDVAGAASMTFDGVWRAADPEAFHARLETADRGASDADVLGDQLARASKSPAWQTVSTGSAVIDSRNRILAMVTRTSDTLSHRDDT